MLLANVDSSIYKVFFLLHILAVIVAFAPGFVSPFLSARAKKTGQPLPPEVSGMLAKNSMQVHGPALVAVGIFGFGLVGISDKTFEFSQTWVSIAMFLWFVMLGIVWGLLIPAEKKVAAGDAAAEARLSAFGGMMHLLLFLMLVDMIWKPGF